MKLQDLRQKLYSKQSDIESRKPKLDTYDPRSNLAPSSDDSQKINEKNKDSEWVIETNTTKKQKTLFMLIGSILLGGFLIAVSGYLVYFFTYQEFKQEQVKIELKAPSAVNINEDFVINLLYSNNNPLDAKNAKITLEFPSNYSLASTKPQANSTNKNIAEWSLSDLKAQQDGIIEIKGRFVRKDEDSVQFKSFLSYTPENFNSEFKNESFCSTRVIGVPLSLNIEPTRTVADGYAVNYQVRVRNNGKEPFQNLVAKITYPQGFSFITSNPELEGEKKNNWKIPTLLSNEEKTLTIEGKLNGKTGDQKFINVTVGIENDEGFSEYIKKDAVSSITEPPVTISQEIISGQSIVHKKDEVRVDIKYQNTSERAINQAMVKVKLNGAIFDYKEGIKPENDGWFDPNTKEIIWQGGKTPELAVLKPNSSGRLSFTVRIADFIPFADNQKTNFTGTTQVSIESPEMPTPVGTNKVVLGKNLEFKLSSFVGFETKVYYSDGTIPNSGPLPPTVGKKTTYTVHWRVTNAFNDLRGVEVKSVLPFGVEWTDSVFPTKTGVTYKPGTREIIWSKDRIPAGAGSETPEVNLVFQIAITPTENDYGKTMELFSESNFKAIDTFTQETITSKTVKKNTFLEDDPTVTEFMSRVIKDGENPY